MIVKSITALDVAVHLAVSWNVPVKLDFRHWFVVGDVLREVVVRFKSFFVRICTC